MVQTRNTSAGDEASYPLSNAESNATIPLDTEPEALTEAEVRAQLLMEDLHMKRAQRAEVEGRTRIAAMEEKKLQAETKALEAQTLVSRAQAAAATRDALSLEEAGEMLSPQDKSILDRHPGVNPKYIAQIVKGTFSAIDLACIRTGKGLLAVANEQSFEVTGDSLTVKKKQGKQSDFGTTMSIWQESWTMYLSIMHQIHGETRPDLIAAMIAFERSIHLVQNTWSPAVQVIPMALEQHQYAISIGITNTEGWVISAEREHRYLVLTVVPSGRSLVQGPSRKRSFDGRPIVSPSKATEPDGTCRMWNSNRCKYGDRCKFEHRCQTVGCGGDHRVTQCPQTQARG